MHNSWRIQVEEPRQFWSKNPNTIFFQLHNLSAVRKSRFLCILPKFNNEMMKVGQSSSRHLNRFANSLGSEYRNSVWLSKRNIARCLLYQQWKFNESTATSPRVALPQNSKHDGRGRSPHFNWPSVSFNRWIWALIKTNVLTNRSFQYELERNVGTTNRLGQWSCDWEKWNSPQRDTFRPVWNRVARLDYKPSSLSTRTSASFSLHRCLSTKAGEPQRTACNGRTTSRSRSIFYND